MDLDKFHQPMSYKFFSVNPLSKPTPFDVKVLYKQTEAYYT